MEQEHKPNPIARMNDAFRKNGRDMYLTQGVWALPYVLGLIKAVQDFDTFTPDNDPCGEHDFGSIVWHKNKTFWKIDHYDQNLQYWHDPLSLDCRRIPTIMLASEY
jgi:hypothetical protein